MYGQTWAHTHTSHGHMDIYTSSPALKHYQCHLHRPHTCTVFHYWSIYESAYLCIYLKWTWQCANASIWIICMWACMWCETFHRWKSYERSRVSNSMQSLQLHTIWNPTNCRQATVLWSVPINTPYTLQIQCIDHSSNDSINITMCLHVVVDKLKWVTKVK